MLTFARKVWILFWERFLTKSRRLDLVRKSRAMQLYRQGMPLATLAQWLGHEDPETTLVYARADTKMKRLAIEKAEAISSPVIQPAEKIPSMWEGNEEMIKRLCGLA